MAEKPARTRSHGSRKRRPLRAKRGIERRRAPRYQVEFEVDYRAEETFLFAYITNVSEMGIFVRTETPEPPGTRLRMRFQPPGFDHPLELTGDVIWINPPREERGEESQAGMGVQFVSLASAQRKALMELVRRLAYLDGSPSENAS